MINSVADAKLFASYMKYPPRGERSWGPYRALRAAGLGMPAFLAEADQWSLAIAMIETAEALDALDDILAVDGIDGVLVGRTIFRLLYRRARSSMPIAPPSMQR